MNPSSSPVSEPPRRRLLIGIATVLVCALIAIGFRWLTAAAEGEKCGGATGCKSGLVCVQLGVELVANVVEHRRCRRQCRADTDCPGAHTCRPIGKRAVRACIPDLL